MADRIAICELDDINANWNVQFTPKTRCGETNVCHIRRLETEKRMTK
jgi:hypothetical protein